MLYKNRNTPRFLILVIDSLIVFVSILLAYLLRFNFNIPTSEFEFMPMAILLIVGVRFITFLLSKIFAGIIRYTEIQDVIRVLAVSFIGSLIIAAVSFAIFYVNQTFIIPRAVLIIELITTSMGLIFFRLLVKISYTEFKSESGVEKTIGIFGAGEAAIMAKAALLRETDVKNKIAVFFDDDEKKIGKKIEGINIQNGKQLKKHIEEFGIQTIIIAVQNISAKRKSEIADVCLELGVSIKDIPPVSSWINGELSAKQIKNINITDLLEREEITLNLTEIKRAYQNKCILITGAAGSIGSEITRQLLNFNPSKLVLFDQAETPLHHLELELSHSSQQTKIDFVIGDVRDKNRLRKAFATFKPQVVFHAAAYKHVPMMENNPAEAVLTNILGTKNTAELAVEFNVETFILVSSDKAVNPTNIMGASKRIAEMFIQSLKSTQIKFVTTRFGNVLGSNGSVIPLFKQQIEERRPITITHPEITRYFMTIPEASLLVLEAGATGSKSEIYVFDMGKSVKIYDLARKMIKLYGLELGKDIQIIFTGLRPGEKLYEELLATSENTIPTDNNKILKAKVRSLEEIEVKAQISKLIESVNSSDNRTIVKLMKELVPEFKSKNSEFEDLD